MEFRLWATNTLAISSPRHRFAQAADETCPTNKTVRRTTPTCIPLNVERAVFRTPKRHDDDYYNGGRDHDRRGRRLAPAWPLVLTIGSHGVSLWSK